MPLETDQHIHLTAAEGFVQLGMFIDPDAELDRIDPFCRHLPEILEVRQHIYRALEKWDLMQAVAHRLRASDPENPARAVSLAYAIRRAESVEKACHLLRFAVDDFSKHALIQYNLACYECQMGNLDEAKTLLQRAFALDDSLSKTALDDTDLKPLWDSMSAPWPG
jgi:tetratricopeptide (TPR) repeat protein